MSGSANSEEPLYQEGYHEGYLAGYAIAVNDVRRAALALKNRTETEWSGAPEVNPPAEAETVLDPAPAAEEVQDDVIRVAPDDVEQPDPATDAQKERNRERANRIGRPGIYRSALALLAVPVDSPEPVVMVGEESGGWWFFLPETWPAPEWRADIRWFSKEGATFTEAPVEPIMQPGDMGDDGDFDDRG